ncbi:hypothetical protein WH47_09615 [Habropoda laboriosa]|uniref:Uncharacterized protein n=1 Tax=Habropoda laboriosa TaxID=597456 RepID=A0A0L7RDY0_9HYME|nr:hypothetical protein WH47_09615 [Habropoda laboriosa]
MQESSTRSSCSSSGSSNSRSSSRSSRSSSIRSSSRKRREEIITTPTSQCRRKVDDPMPGDALSPLTALASLLHRPLQPPSP